MLGKILFIGGRQIAAFEREHVGFSVSHCLGVETGPTRSRIALRALGIGLVISGSRPLNSFVATAEAVCGRGARRRSWSTAPPTTPT